MTNSLTPEAVAELLLSDPDNITPFKQAYKAGLEGHERCFKDFLDLFMDDYDVVRNHEIVFAAIWILAAEDAISQSPVVRAIEHESPGIVFETFERLTNMVRKAWERYTQTERQPVTDMVRTKPDGVAEYIDYHELAMELISAGNDAQISRLLTGTTTDDRKWFLNRLLNEVITKTVFNTGICVWLTSNCDLMGYIDDAMSSFRRHVYIPEAEQQRATQSVAKLLHEQARQPVSGLENDVEEKIEGMFEPELDPDLD